MSDGVVKLGCGFQARFAKIVFFVFRVYLGLSLFRQVYQPMNVGVVKLGCGFQSRVATILMSRLIFSLFL
jgi:O-methyltransferase involved in polyketide biosynthesis